MFILFNPVCKAKRVFNVCWLATRLQVNFFLANLKVLDVISIYSLQVSSFMH